jgi:hypothetical protein
MPDINLSPLTAEQTAINRRRKMAEAMQQQAVLPIDMPNVPGVKISPYQGLAKLLQGYIAGKNLEKADTEQKALEANTMSDFAKIFGLAGRTETVPGAVTSAAVPSAPIPENIAQQAELERLNQPRAFFEAKAAYGGNPILANAEQIRNLPTMSEAQAEVREPSQQVPALKASMLEDPKFTQTSAGRMMLAQALMQQQAQQQAAAQRKLEAEQAVIKIGPEDTAGRIIGDKFVPFVTGAKQPKWEKFSKFDLNGQEIIGLINKNAPDPFSTFIEGAKKPEDLVSVDTTNDQGQAVTRYFNKSDPLLKSGVPKPLVGILGDLQTAGALPPNWKENPAIVDLVNTSLVNKAGGITPKNIFDFKIALADLAIKKATLADQGVTTNVAIPTAPAPTTGVLGAIQSRPVSQSAIPTTQAAPVVAPTVAAQPKGRYTPLNAPRAAALAPAPAPAAVPTASNLSPRDQREIEKQKLMSANKDMTETQSNAALFGGAMAQANATMKELEKAGTVKNAVIPAMMQSLVGLVPLGVGEKVADQIESIARTDPTSLVGPDADQQRLAQAQIAFSTAWLRKTSGASFGASEISNTIKEFFPMIGEGDKVIKQKREARERAIDGMRIGTTKEGQAYIDRYMGDQPKSTGKWTVVK